MGEENTFEFRASQESELPSSQESSLLSEETFQLLWQELVFPSPGINPNALINDINLHSCTLPDAANEQLVLSEENSNQGNLQINKHVVHTSKPLSSQIVSSGLSHPSSSLPASENWPGQYDFTVSFNPQNKDTKGVAWTYSEIKDKLYVGKDVPCPINFSVNTVMPPDNVTIRAMALYSSPEQVSEIVHRCVNHSMKEINNGQTEAEHLVRCECSTATYNTDAATGRHSVIVPFENPAVGQQYSTYIYKFACFGSCSGGPNRRPLMLVFTLESGNQVIGRRKLDVKICACPGRDRSTDEAQCMSADVAPQSKSVRRKAASELINLSEVMEFSKHVYLPPPKKSKATPDEDGVYRLDIEDKECYDFLHHMKKLYDICKYVRGFPPDFIAKAKNLCPKQSEE